jgi:hypothetical protein
VSGVLGGGYVSCLGLALVAGQLEIAAQLLREGADRGHCAGTALIVLSGCHAKVR